MVDMIWRLRGQVRKPTAAGVLYPDDAMQLETVVTKYLEGVENKGRLKPKVIVAPSADYMRSGAIAAEAYAGLAKFRSQIKNVVLLGQDHTQSLRGIATSSANSFSTPLGQVPLDRHRISRINALNGVMALDYVHAQEDSLELQLPFLQVMLGDFKLTPFIVGDVGGDVLVDVLSAVWGGEETLIVVGSKLAGRNDLVCVQQLVNQHELRLMPDLLQDVNELLVGDKSLPPQSEHIASH